MGTINLNIITINIVIVISKIIQAGITAWGVGCGEENVPGVYASMAEATCFIDWATKCKHGDKYNEDYNFEGYEISYYNT